MDPLAVFRMSRFFTPRKARFSFAGDKRGGGDLVAAVLVGFFGILYRRKVQMRLGEGAGRTGEGG